MSLSRRSPQVVRRSALCVATESQKLILLARRGHLWICSRSINASNGSISPTSALARCAEPMVTPGALIVILILRRRQSHLAHLRGRRVDCADFRALPRPGPTHPTGHAGSMLGEGSGGGENEL